jgi:hemin uptake protein HemP
VDDRPPADVTTDAAAVPPTATVSDDLLPSVDVQVLLLGQRMISLHYGQRRYRLQITRQGKLILTS